MHIIHVSAFIQMHFKIIIQITKLKVNIFCIFLNAFYARIQMRVNILLKLGDEQCI